MKAIKYLVMGVLLAGFSSTAMAQEEELNAALQAVKSNAANKAELIKVAQKKNKKNAEGLVKLGRALYEAKDTAAASACANMAQQAVKPKFSCAPAWMLLGDIEAAFGTDGGKAANYYNQAIYFDPKNPEGYKSWAKVYRKISPSQAAAKLKEMEQNCPGEDANAMIGHIYMLSYNASKKSEDEKAAYEAYKKADINKLDKTGFNEFARSSYFQGKYDDALKVCEAGLKKFPRYAMLVRLSMFANYELGNYEAAKSFINRYFNETDSAKFSEYDYYYTALIHKALNDKENAYKAYDQALSLVNDSSMIKKWDILKAVSDSYKSDENFDNALKFYKDYLDTKPEVTSDDYDDLAKIYQKYAESDETKKVEMIGKAIATYREMGEKFPIQNVFATYQSATMSNKLDKNGEKGLAKADYQKVVELLEGKADRTNGENTMLKYSYHYLMSNAFLFAKNKTLAKEYANKILTIDPEYAPALQIRDLK